MLKLNEEPFISSSAKYYDENPEIDSLQASIYVEITIPGQYSIQTLAKLDTGTPWVILNSQLNKTLGFTSGSSDIVLHTPTGRMSGSLEKYPIILRAPKGKSLEIEATLYICDNWNKGNYIGYTGLLDKIRFAIDPSCNFFYFGPIN